MSRIPFVALLCAGCAVTQPFQGPMYDIGEGPQTMVNPTIVEGDGEWVFDEGCLSVPGLSWEIVRPKEVHLTGWDLEGNEVSVEADEYLARVFQHEMDHLDGILLLERLDEDQAKAAKKAVRELMLTGRAPAPSPPREGLSLP